MNGFPSGRRLPAVVVAIVAGGLALVDSSAGAGEDFRVGWYSINGGAGTASIGGDYRLRGSIGQAVSGTVSGGDYELNAGFWQARRASCATTPDRLFCNGFED